MEKFAYFNPPNLRMEEAPPPASWGDLWGDSLSLLNLYCERSAAGWWQEPLNTWSSLLFLLAAFAAFRICRGEHARENVSKNASKNAASSASADRTRFMLCLDLSAIGLTSWAFHASGWDLFALFDVLAILVFTIRASFALFVRGLALSGLQAFLGVVAIFALAPLFSYLPLVGDALWGVAFHLSPILTLGLLVLLMLLRAKRQSSKHPSKHPSKKRASSPLPPDLLRSTAGLGAAFVVLAASLTLRTQDLPLCADWTYGTHFLWHAQNAIALLLVIVFLPKMPAATTPRTTP